ncbi:sigma factor-like helix-turn-helix DNA-binding protein [Frigoriglobus tundricola]|uniref:ECF RNA polymerase sigma factor SigE n=1 Tax=Frigoriglobus tundricola TaxID=2774151 RepID=A0A6M5Z3A6_9BACT|nr:sigma factor-like helix-turn-helix DNA-binding protein [Frigoriglobus tundricola]QJX00227.1 hypothetical protein FTUN_7851 [Frigoriglobus tundricola]
MSRFTLLRVASRSLRAQDQAVRPTDADLLARFAATHDELAFTELVARHGGMVRGTARRCVHDAHVAEDVYQAAFFVLARKAGAIRWRGTVAPWLHATTVRLARKARGRVCPAPASCAETMSPAADPSTTAAWAESCRVLDEELAALPDELRGPLVLCYLKGYSRDEAAAALACSLAMLKRRLERGRVLLRDRLTRRGVTLPAAGIGVLVCDLGAGTAATGETARAAVAFATRGTAPPDIVALVAPTRGGFAVKTIALLAAAAGVLACGITFASFSNSVSEAPYPSNDPPPAMPAEAKSSPDVPSEALPAHAVARLGSVRLRASGRVERMAFSPDGTRLATWSGDSHVTDELTIWDSKTGRALRRVALPGARVDLLAWLPDGRGVALVRSDFTNHEPLVWEFTDEKAAKPEVKPRPGTVTKFVVQGAPVQDDEHNACYAISPDGKVLAIGKAGQLDSDREVQLWELKTGVKVNALKPLKGGVIHPGNCGNIHFAPDGKTLVVFTATKHLGNNKWENEQLVTVWDVKTSKEKVRFKAPRPAANPRPAVNVFSTALAIGLESGDTSMWDLTTGKERTLATEHKSKKPDGGYGTFCLAFAPDGKTLATGGRDHVTKLWDLASGKLVYSLTDHEWVEALAFDSSGKRLASAGQSGLIRLRDTATGANACPLPGHTQAVWSVALNRDGSRAVTAARDGTLRFWDVAAGTEQRSIPVGAQGLTLSPDGKTVLAATEEGKLRTWDRATGRETTPANLPVDMKSRHLSFTPDGKHLIAAGGPQVTVFDWPGLKVVRAIDLPKPGTRAVPGPVEGENHCDTAAVSPDGKWLVTVAHRYWFRERDGLHYGYAADGIVDLWDLATGTRTRRLAEAEGTFRSGTFTADGRFVLVGAGGVVFRPDGSAGETFKGEMNLLDPVSGTHVRGFEVPPAAASVSFRYSGASALAPDGHTLYVSYNTGEIIGYEVATGRARRTLLGHRGYIGGLAFSGDGRRLISGSHDGTALVWDVTLTGATAPRPTPLTEAEVEKLWQTAGRDDAKTAFAAQVELLASPDEALKLLSRTLKPAPVPTDAALDRIFTDLDSDVFDTREKASKELDEYAEGAVPDVRKRLEAKPSAEVRQRADAFLKRFDGPALSPARLQQTRAVELLEALGTPAAKKQLTELASGASHAPLTRDARAALKRLGQP